MTEQEGRPERPPHRRRWGHLAATWALSFAGLHVYWALGGSVGLAESAGAALADDRPGWFVAIGLYGVAALLAAAGVLGLVLTRLPAGRRRLVLLAGAGVAVVLLLRALTVHLLLLAHPGYGEGAVSPAQRSWTLVVWNPWFLAGGLAFALATLAARRAGPVGPGAGAPAHPDPAAGR